MKIMFFVTSLPFLCMYAYAAYQSRRFAAIAGQPAGLAFILFCGLIVRWFILAVFMFTAPGNIIAQKVLAASYIPFTIGLLICVFGWRRGEEATYRGPAIFAGLGVAVPLIAPVLIGLAVQSLHDGSDPESMLPVMIVVGCLNSALSFAGLVLLYKAIFGWRGYDLQQLPGTVPLPAVADTVAEGGNEGTTAAPAQPLPEPPGVFEERDFIPYICGVMLLGGCLIVPVIWGMFLDLSYEKSLFPSILSCGVFALSHTKKGNFLFGRFIVLNLYVFFTIMRTAAKYGSGGGKPMFMAGGALGFIVMAVCGWAGIGVMRLLRKLVAGS
ncbi:MAG: hypothetical protein H6756_04500 [Candidatus Omnitrophica bacterium]|nr:hypothetical protein [Candidatus Omnitrophota bacterium]